MGTFVGLTGLSSPLGALSRIGFGLLMLHVASRDVGAFALQWRKTLWRLLGSSLVPGAIYLALAATWLDSPVAIAALLAIAGLERLLVPLATLASSAFPARHGMGWAGAIYGVGPLGAVRDRPGIKYAAVIALIIGVGMLGLPRAAT